MKKAVGIITISVLVCISGILYVSSTVPVVRYVKTEELVYKYQGMIEAQQKFKVIKAESAAQRDTMQQQLKQAVERYRANSSTLLEQEKQQQEMLLNYQQRNLEQHVIRAEQRMKEEENMLLEGVLNQINSFVQEFGNERGYDLVLGTDNSGNVLHGKQEWDITEEVLEELNSTYYAEQ